MDGPMMDTSQSHKLLKVRQQQVYRDSFTRALGFFSFLEMQPLTSSPVIPSTLVVIHAQSYVSS